MQCTGVIQFAVHQRCSAPGIRSGNNSPIAASAWGLFSALENILQLEIKGWKSNFTSLFQVTTYRRCSPHGIRGGNNSPIAASGWGTPPAPGHILQFEIKEWKSKFTHLIQVAVHWRCFPPGIRGGNNSPIAASAWGLFLALENIMQLEINEWKSKFTHLIQVTVHRRCSPPGIHDGTTPLLPLPVGNTSGTRKHLATWNKRVNFNFHTFNSSYNLPEMFPNWNPQWKQLPHCRFRLGNIAGTRTHLATWNKLK